MITFDPLDAAMNWFDAYRAATLSITEMYADDASVECACGGVKQLHGRVAISEYWRQRFVQWPAGELADLQPDGARVVLSYRVPEGLVQAILWFDGEGKIRSSVCGQAADVIAFRR